MRRGMTGFLSKVILYRTSGAAGTPLGPKLDDWQRGLVPAGRRYQHKRPMSSCQTSEISMSTSLKPERLVSRH